MAKLLKKIEEVRKHVPSNMTADFDKISPFLDNAEKLYVYNLIGKDEFNSIAAVYEAAEFNLDNVIDPVIKQAIFFAQKISSNLGYLFGVPIISLSIGSGGIQIQSNSEKKTAFQWQTDELKDSLQELGHTAIEELLEWLEEHPDKFSAYIASENYAKQKRFLISNAKDFSQYFDIRASRFLFQNLCSIMYRVEAQTMEKLFGEDFYQSLKADDASEVKKKLATKYIKPALALLTGAKSIKERIFSYNNGVVGYNFVAASTQNIKENKELSEEKIEPLYKSLTDDANAFLQDAQEFIAKNATDLPEFIPQEAKRRFKATNRKDSGLFMT